MAMTLYGSLASPYVRRVRLALEGIDHNFQLVDVYDAAGRAEYARHTPIKKLPMLVDDDTVVFDSHLIRDYLGQKLGLPEPSVEEHNIVYVIDAATDSLVIILQTQRSGLTADPEKLFYQLQFERIPACLDWLERKARDGAFDEWRYPAIALISLLDWARFRNLYDFSQYPALESAGQRHAQRAIVQATAPR